jgi:hypothetical protein
MRGSAGLFLESNATDEEEFHAIGTVSRCAAMTGLLCCALLCQAVVVCGGSGCVSAMVHTRLS